MSSGPSFVLDRHLFASNASAYNAAWESYGWTAGLDRTRAGRLEERVPWAAELAELADPPVLIDGGGSGAAADAAAGGGAADIGALPEAFLPLDGRLGFSVSGVIRASGGGSAPGGRLRTATHTVLFAEGLFEEIDGFPQGLHMVLSGGEGDEAGGVRAAGRAAWFAEMGRSVPSAPGPLPEVACSPDRSRFRAARLGEVARAAGAVGAAAGRGDAVGWLGATYRAMGAVVAGGRGCVAVTAPGDTGSGLLAAEIVRLAWLSLPLADRRRVYYSTTWLGGRRPEPCLAVWPSGRRAGDRGAGVTLVVAGDGARGAGAVRRDGAGDLQRARLRRWAEMVLGGGGDFACVARRIDVRGMSLFQGRSGPYIVYGAPAAHGDRIDVAERARWEADGAGRWRGLGWMAAAALPRTAAASRGSWISSFLEDPRLANNPAFFDGVARRLLGHVLGPEAGRLAVLAGVRADRRQLGIALVVDGLRVLVRSGAGAGEIARVLRSVEDRDGPGAAAEMTRIALGLLHSRDSLSEIPVLLDSVRNGGVLDPSVVVDAAAVAKEWLARSGTADDGLPRLLRQVWSAAAGCREGLGVDAMHHLGWTELRSRGRLSLATLVTEGDSRAASLAGRLVQRDPDPPLSVYLALRRALSKEAVP